MGTVLVVVAEVAIEHSWEVSIVRDEERVGALRWRRAHPALGDGVRVGGPHGTPKMLPPWPGHTASKPGPNLPSRSPSRCRMVTAAWRRSSLTLRAHWVTQSRVGLVVMPARKTRRVW